MAAKHTTLFSQKDSTCYNKWLRVAKWQGLSQFICVLWQKSCENVTFWDISQKWLIKHSLFDHRNSQHIMTSNKVIIPSENCRNIFFQLYHKPHGFLFMIFWQNMLYSWRVLPFGLATAPSVFTILTKPILFLCHHKDYHIGIYLYDILVLVCSK